MPNLKEIRGRIDSIGSTIQITNAMKMVSAAKLKKAQDAITQMRPYATKLRELLENVTSTLEGDSINVLTESRPVNNVLVLVVSSNRGLCGAFNSSIMKAIHGLMKTELAGKNVVFDSIGKKSFDLLKNQYTIGTNRSELWNNLNYANVASIADEMTQAFTTGQVDRVLVIYNHFKNAALQEVTVEQLLPLSIEKTAPTPLASNATDYIFEPNKIELVNELIPKTLKIQLYKAILDSNASEHGARMTAMHKATDNAKELKNELNLTYNKARQASITKEILEIVGGAEALDN